MQWTGKNIKLCIPWTILPKYILVFTFILFYVKYPENIILDISSTLDFLFFFFVILIIHDIISPSRYLNLIYFVLKNNNTYMTVMKLVKNILEN